MLNREHFLTLRMETKQQYPVNKQTNVFAQRNKLLNECKTHFLLIMKTNLQGIQHGIEEMLALDGVECCQYKFSISDPIPQVHKI